MSLGELSCVYSTLILQDDNVDVIADKIKTLLKAANITVESYWPTLFVKALEDVNLSQLVANVGSGVGSAAPGPAGGAPAADKEAQAAKEEVKEEKKEESEESDDDMGFGLFD
ncbi:60S acidic ribosomal protein P1-like [Centruroides sculpturatus]|uniref:60S acidic ribosomal protein P1-like n=1 Tax=Centruroides sculpturatus TaxID=218467 RepID=UPI000C6D326D|nr:60S acidic ribosomal protein P1-like [Centruroides sculpturatus]